MHYRRRTPSLKQQKRCMKTRNIVFLCALGLASYSVTMLAEIPASLIPKIAPAEAPVRLGSLQGTVWKGKADYISMSLQGHQIVLPQVAWQISAFDLLLGGLQVHLNVGDNNTAIAANADVRVSFGGVDINNATVDTDLAWIKEQFPLSTLEDTSATVRLNLTEFSWQDQQCEQLIGKLSLKNIKATLPAVGVLGLGNGDARLSCQPKKLIAKLKQSSSVLSSTGSFDIDSNGRYQFNSSVIPSLNAPSMLKDGLKMLGSADAKGGYPLSFSGRM